MKRLLALACLALLLAAPAALGQEPPPAQQGASQPAGAPVVWEGRELYRVYGSYGPYTAEERARLATERLGRAIRDGRSRPA